MSLKQPAAGNGLRGKMPFATDTAETVIDALEDAADYKAFERPIKSNYSPQTAIESQLVSRLASLLWRLRRAVIVAWLVMNQLFEQQHCRDKDRPTQRYCATQLRVSVRRQ